MPPACRKSREEGTPWLRHRGQTNRRELPRMPRRYLSTILAEPPCSPVMGGCLWGKGTDPGTGRFFGEISTGWDTAAATSVRSARRTVGDDQWLRAVPQR